MCSSRPWPRRRGSHARLAVAAVLLLAPAAPRTEEAGGSGQTTSLVPDIGLPTTAGGARSGEGGSHVMEPPSEGGVSAERFGVTMDLPEWLGHVTGWWKAPSAEEQAKKTSHLTLAPIISVSPLVGVGFGVAAAGTRQFGDPATTRLSKFTTSFTITTEKQYAVPIRSDINLPGGDWNLVGVWRWAKFPSPTWGLGGNTPESAKTTIDYQLLRFYEIANRRVANNFYIGAGYKLDYYFNQGDQSAGTDKVTDFQTYPYGTGTTSLNSSLVANVLYDSRDSNVFPSRGFYANFAYAFTPRLLGSYTTWQSLYLDARTYFRVHRRAVLAFWTYGWVDFGEVPYLELPSIGSDPDARSGRGYIEGRHIGKALIYGEAELRYVVWEWFGVNVGVNVHSVSEPGQHGILADEPRFQYWWPALTVGARLLVVKPSNSNLCIDFAWGRAGERAVYFNFAEAF